MTQDEAIKLFYEFLIENNALFNYLQYSSFERLQSNSPIDYLFCMKIWESTNQGHKYWDSLCDKWWEILKKNNLYEYD